VAVMEGHFDALETNSIKFDFLDKLCPRISFLCFGTFAGSSVGQRTDLLVPGLFTSAYSNGILKVKQGNMKRSFLSLNVLAREVHVLIHESPVNQTKFNIFHLASFKITILQIATTVSSITGATISLLDDPIVNASGFSLRCDKFISFFTSHFMIHCFQPLKVFMNQFHKH
jgi:nucleoside-diphosphate-sugar epimerase